MGALVLRQGSCRKLALCRPLLHQFHTELYLQFRLWHLLPRRTFPTRLFASVLPLGLGCTLQRRLLAAHGRRQFGDGGAAGVAAGKGAAGLHQDGRLQGVQQRRGSKIGAGRIYADGGDGAVARGVKAMRAAPCRTVAATSLRQTQQAVLAGLVGGLDLQRVSSASAVL